MNLTVCCNFLVPGLPFERRDVPQHFKQRQRTAIRYYRQALPGPPIPHHYRQLQGFAIGKLSPSLIRDPSSTWNLADDGRSTSAGYIREALGYYHHLRPVRFIGEC